MVLKIGVIGCSDVSKRQFFPAIDSSQLADVECIGSRSLKKAEEWAKKYDCDKFGSYDDVINSDVDAVYISLPIALHHEWTLKAAKAGKHVLCEKSSTTSYESAKKMIETCKENNVRILEAFAFRFHPQHKQLQKLIDEELGEIGNFYGTFGFPPPAEDNIRWKKELGGGVLNDVTCYPLYASRLIFQSEPASVLAHLQFDKKFSVDKSADIILTYPNEKTAFISSGFNRYFQSKYSIWGSQAKITTKRAYGVPHDYETSIYLHKDDKIIETSIPPAHQFALMFDIFCNVISKKIQNPYCFEDDLLAQAKLMESIRISSREKRLVILSELE